MSLDDLQRQYNAVIALRNARVDFYRKKIDEANREFDEMALPLRREIAKLGGEPVIIPPVSKPLPRRKGTKKPKEQTATMIVRKSDGTEMEISV